MEQKEIVLRHTYKQHRFYPGGTNMENDKKRISVEQTEPNETKAKVVIVSVIIIIGLVALLTCIYGIIPAMIEDVRDLTS